MEPLPERSSRHSLFAGGAGLLLAFALGVLFALLPLYYFFLRDVPPTGANSTRKAALPVAKQIQSVAEAPSAPSADASRFASRMTFELSSIGAEAPIPLRDIQAVDTFAGSTAAARAANASAVPAGMGEQISPPERVANARPIGAVARASRGGSAELDKTVPQTQYREAAASSPTPVATLPGRVIEGREVHLKPRTVEDR